MAGGGMEQSTKNCHCYVTCGDMLTKFCHTQQNEASVQNGQHLLNNAQHHLSLAIVKGERHDPGSYFDGR